MADLRVPVRAYLVWFVIVPCPPCVGVGERSVSALRAPLRRVIHMILCTTTTTTTTTTTITLKLLLLLLLQLLISNSKQQQLIHDALIIGARAGLPGALGPSTPCAGRVHSGHIQCPEDDR